MKNLPIEALRALVTIEDQGGISAATELLGRSQPAISLQIKKLEENLNKSLFIRRNKKLTLTSDGKTVYHVARQILSLQDQLITNFSETLLAGQVSLGIPSEFATTLLPKIIGRFANAYPDINLEVFSDLSRNLLSEKQRQQYDLILALHDKPSPKRRGLIKTDQLVWVGSPNLNADKLAQQMKKEVSLVLAQDGCIYRKRVLQALNKHHINSRIVHTNPDLSGIKLALQEELGITALARSTVSEDLQILSENLYQLPSLGAIDISLLYNKRDASDATLRLASYIQTSLQ